MSTLRDLILSVEDLPEEEVNVPEWNVKVLIIGMTAEQRASFALDGDEDDRERFLTSGARMIVLTAHDPSTREPLFTMEDVPALLGKSGSAIERLTGPALRLSGMGREEEKEIEAEFR